MDMKEFNNVIEEQIQRCRDTLTCKGKEYATEDRLHAFKTSAQLKKETTAQALAGMMVKHTTSIYDMISSGKPYPKEVWDEKITDHINYLLILSAIVRVPISTPFDIKTYFNSTAPEPDQEPEDLVIATNRSPFVDLPPKMRAWLLYLTIQGCLQFNLFHTGKSTMPYSLKGYLYPERHPWSMLHRIEINIEGCSVFGVISELERAVATGNLPYNIPSMNTVQRKLPEEPKLAKSIEDTLAFEDQEHASQPSERA